MTSHRNTHQQLHCIRRNISLIISTNRHRDDSNTWWHFSQSHFSNSMHARLWNFITSTIFRVYNDHQKKEKEKLCSYVEENALLMLGVRVQTGQTRWRLQYRKAAGTQTTGYRQPRSAEQHLWTPVTLKQYTNWPIYQSVGWTVLFYCSRFLCVMASIYLMYFAQNLECMRYFMQEQLVNHYLLQTFWIIWHTQIKQ